MVEIYEKLLKYKNYDQDTSMKIIATYFLETEISLLVEQGINAIAAACYTTKSSISRFVRTLGLNDFKYFKHELIEERKKIISFESKRNASDLENIDDNYKKIMTETITHLRYNISEIFHSRSVIVKLVDAIKQTKHVAIFSSGKIYSDMTEFVNLMQIKDKNVIYIQNEVLKRAYLENERNEDVIMFILNNNSHVDDYLQILSALKDRKDNIFIICPIYQDEVFKGFGTTIFFKFQYEYSTITQDPLLLQTLLYIIGMLLNE